MTVKLEDFRRENVWLRMFLMGPSGAGKTRGALEVATNLYDGALDVGVIDTEHGRAKLYADRYRVAGYAEITDDFSPKSYIKALSLLLDKGCRVIVVDSASHEWVGPGGILSQADKFGDWKTVRPKHHEFTESLLAAQAHLIVTCRAKMKYEVGEEEAGGRTKQVIRKLGVGPVQSDDIIYEFDVVGMIDVSSHETTFSNRCDPLVDRTFSLYPGKEVADILTGWLSEGTALPEPTAADDDQIEELLALLTEEGFPEEQIEERFGKVKIANRGVLPPEYVREQITRARDRLATKAPA